MPRTKLPAPGLNLNSKGSYIRPDKAQRLRALLIAKQRKLTEERSFASELFTLTEERLEKTLQREEFEAAAQIAFPECWEMIADIYQHALKIAKQRRNAPDIRPL